MEIVKINKNETLYCLNEVEYQRIKDLYNFMNNKLYNHVYRHSRITLNEYQCFIKQFKGVLFDE